MVNGEPLASNTPYRLKSGDELQFGVDVNRNEEYFVARTYTFEARFVPTAYSLGFTVPDADSDDEEVVVMERRGSQSNPVTLDDSDDEEITFLHESTIPPQEIQDVTSEDLFIPEEEEDLVPAVTVVQDSFAKEDGDIQVRSSDMGMDDDESSVASSEKELDYPSSEQEVPDSEDEGDAESLPAFFADDEVDMADAASFANNFAEDQTVPLQLPSFGVVFNHAALGEEQAPPLPPRPSSGVPLPTADMWRNDGAAFLPLPDLDVGPRIDEQTSMPRLYIFDDSHPAPESLHLTVSQQAHRLQTPPPMPATDVTTPPDLQPARRTKVSIEEIVEEQPPTPTSVKDLKRKADELDEDVSEEEVSPIIKAAMLDDTEITAAQAARAASPAAIAQSPAVIAQRPKKEPRSLLRKLGQGVKYPLLSAAGAVAAFTLLATAPDSFFAV